jgi:hypothetical protein
MPRLSGRSSIRPSARSAPHCKQTQTHQAPPAGCQKRSSSRGVLSAASCRSAASRAASEHPRWDCAAPGNLTGPSLLMAAGYQQRHHGGSVVTITCSGTAVSMQAISMVFVVLDVVHNEHHHSLDRPPSTLQVGTMSRREPTTPSTARIDQHAAVQACTVLNADLPLFQNVTTAHNY